MDILITSNYGRKIMKPANLTHGPPTRMRNGNNSQMKWNKFGWTFTKTIPAEKLRISIF